MDARSALKPIFLSAGIPDPKRNPKYYGTMDSFAIREAVSALTMVVTPAAKLIFGGHPAVSPFVYQTAKAMNAVDNVVIYQSEFFRSQVPKESLAFNQIVWTTDHGDVPKSLEMMRGQMIGNHQDVAGVFIGGMEGIEDECAMFRAHHPSATVLPIASTGAAARILFDCNEGPTDKATRDLLEREHLYQWLFRKLLGIQP